MFNVVLVEPRIPQNTGNIARTCAATGCRLHIVRPTAFQITDKNLKRAGLDYWHLLNVCYYDNLADFFEKTEGARYFYATTKAPHNMLRLNLRITIIYCSVVRMQDFPRTFVRTRRTLYKNTYDRRGEKS